jgi:hypothetical protein
MKLKKLSERIKTERLTLSGLDNAQMWIGAASMIFFIAAYCYGLYLLKGIHDAVVK